MPSPITKLRTHFHRSGFALADQVIVGGMNFLTMILVGRMAGAHQLGLFALGLSIMLLVVALQESVITTPATIIGPRLGDDQRRRYFGHAVLTQVALSVTVCIALLASATAAWFFTVTAEIVVGLIVMAFVVPFWCLRELARRLAFAEFNARGVLLLDATVAILLAAGLVGLIVADRLTAASAFAVAGAATGVGSVAFFILNRTKFRFQLGGLSSSLRRNWVAGKWMVVGQTASIATGETMPWIIAGTLGTEATGVFAACRAIFRLVSPVVVTVSNLLTPYAAHAYAAGGQRDVNTVVKRTVLGLGALMSVFFLFILLVGGPLLGLLFGPAYAEHHWVLVVLAAAQWMLLMRMGPGRALLVMDRPQLAVAADLVECAIVIGISLPLIHWLNLHGAAGSYLVGALAAACLTFVLYWKASAQAEVRRSLRVVAGSESEPAFAESEMAGACMEAVK